MDILARKKEYTASKIVITKAMGTSDVMDWNLESITKRDIRVSDLKRMAGASDMKKGGILFGKEKNEITIRSSAAEYLTYVASVGDQQDSIEMRYEDENIWLTQKMMATL